MKNQIDSGTVINYANASGSTISGGDVVVIGKMVGIAVVDIADGENGAVALKGKYTLDKKTTGDDITAGAVLKYDSGVEMVSAGATFDTVIVGRAAQAAGTAATTVEVILGL